MTPRYVAALVHGRYWLVPAETAGPAPLLLGCHGYGETALDLLDQLRRIPGSQRWHVCAVDALHPFYRAKTGEVVRSWMTKDDRELTIADNIRYVASVVDAVKREVAVKDRIVVAGFSQGVAMAYRVALRGGFPCHGLIVLAGDVPADALEPRPLAWPQILIGRGETDEWYGPNKMADDVSRLAAVGVEARTTVFAAGHEWHDDFFKACSDFLNTLAG